MFPISLPPTNDTNVLHHVTNCAKAPRGEFKTNLMCERKRGGERKNGDSEKKGFGGTTRLNESVKETLLEMKKWKLTLSKQI